jgi:hypothetical protein
MEYLKERTFEIFRYILPGLLAMASILCLDSNIIHPYDLLTKLKAFAGADVLLATVIAFVIGLVLDEANLVLINILKINRFKVSYNPKNNLTTAEKYSLIRKYSLENFKYVEYWYIMKGMCQNIGLVFVSFLFISIFKLFQSANTIPWLLCIFCCIVSIIGLYKRGIDYARFARQELDSTIDILGLIDKPNHESK